LVEIAIAQKIPTGTSRFHADGLPYAIQNHPEVTNILYVFYLWQLGAAVAVQTTQLHTSFTFGVFSMAA